MRILIYIIIGIACGAMIYSIVRNGIEVFRKIKSNKEEKAKNADSDIDN